MGQFKDAVFVEIWRHLKTMRNNSAHLSTLNSPASSGYGVRRAWGELQSHLKEERLKKGVGMKVIIGERPDIFVLTSSDTGHPVVTLTPAAQIASPDDGVEKRLPTLAAEAPPEGAMSGDAIGGGASAVSPFAAAEQQALAAAGLAGSAPAASQKKQRVTSSTGTGRQSYAVLAGPVWAGSGRGYLDLIWTPKVEAARDREKRKEWAMVRALYEAVDSYDGEPVTISQMGIDFKVAQLKKDPQFQFEKLVDVLKRYEEVFEVSVDSTKGFVAKLQPGAMVALPDAEEALQQAINEAELMLPERIRNPTNIKDRMQSLRIEVVYALHRRGGSASLQELGQEHRVQKMKANIAQAKKLIDFIKIFPQNFGITYDENMQAVLSLANINCDDTSMIETSIHRNNAAFASGHYGSYGAQRGGRYNPSGSSRAPYGSSSAGYSSGGSSRAPYTPGAQRPMPTSSAPALPPPVSPGQFAMPPTMPIATLAALLQQPSPAPPSGFSDSYRL